jgi:hypothetical protein
MVNKTKGYHSGDDCPAKKPDGSKCKGIIEIRETEHSNHPNVQVIKYAQCTQCSWNTK